MDVGDKGGASKATLNSIGSMHGESRKPIAIPGSESPGSVNTLGYYEYIPIIHFRDTRVFSFTAK